MTRPPYGAVGYLGINHSHAPLSNPLVQQAIAMPSTVLRLSRHITATAW